MEPMVSRMVLFVVDVDWPGHNDDGPATPAWRDEQAPKIDALLAAHPGGFVYESRGGYRLVYGLPAPFPIRSTEDDGRWVARYKGSLRYLERRFGIVGDVACADWTRIYRAPHVVRDGVPQELATRGAPSTLGTWAPVLARGDVVRAKPPAPIHGEVQPVPIQDPANEYGQSRLSGAIHYLERAPLSIEGRGGRDQFFSVCCMLMRRLRLPLDIALDCIDAIYNPRLQAVGTTTWGRDEIENRLASARDTSSEVPPGDVFDEETWTEINGKLRAS